MGQGDSFAKYGRIRMQAARIRQPERRLSETEKADADWEREGDFKGADNPLY